MDVVVFVMLLSSATSPDLDWVLVNLLRSLSFIRRSVGLGLGPILMVMDMVEGELKGSGGLLKANRSF